MARRRVDGRCRVRTAPVLVALVALACGRSLSRSARAENSAGDTAVGGSSDGATGGSSGASDAGTSTGGASAAGAPACGEGVSGSARWWRTFERLGGNRVSGIGRCGDGLCVGGDFQGEILFESKLAAVATYAAYVAKLTLEGEPVWSRRLGGNALSDRFVVRAFVADPRGGIALAGAIDGELVLPPDENGMTTLLSADASDDAILVRLRDDGTLAWYDRLGLTTGFPGDFALAFDASGVLVVAASTRNRTDPGLVNDPQLVLRAYDVDGEELFTRTLPGTAVPMSLGLDADGNIFLLSYILNTVVFPDGAAGTEVSASGARFCVVALDRLGLFRWSQCPDGESQLALPFDMVVDERGNLVVTGGFYGRIGFAPSPFDPAPREILSSLNDDDEDVVVAKLDSSGALLWQKRFGTEGIQSATLGIAVASGDAIVIAGEAWGSFDFGDASAPIGRDSSSAFLVELDDEGRHVWSRTLGPTAATTGRHALFRDSSRACDTLYFATDYSGTFESVLGSKPEAVDGILVGELFR